MFQHALLHRFLKAQRGVALIEFALVFPLIMVLLVGALEIGRGIIITQRVERAGYVMADVTSQYLPATEDRSAGEINEPVIRTEVLSQLSRIMGRFADPAQQAVIITSVQKQGAIKRIRWQVAGGGSLSAGANSVVNGLSPSAVGPGVRDQPTSFSGEVEALLTTMADGENMIVAEVFYFYQPIWTHLVNAIPQEGNSRLVIATPRLLAKRMYFRPRHGDLVCLPPSFTYPECEPEPTP